jgi:N-acetylneuraminic acid mutarotase
MNLTAHAGKIYRVGGMAPRNQPGDAADNHSTAGCARFDPATGKWEPLPPLPEPRSSHDVVVVGNQLIVAGGWNLKGSQQEWVDTLAVLNLARKKLEWKTVPEPFRRRALISVAYQDRLYVIGGFNDKNQIVRNVSIYDPNSDAWSEGPELPEGAGRAFAPAAVIHQGRLYTSVSDGTLLRLDDTSKTWEKAGRATGRVAHRLVSYADKVLVIGGAAGGKNFDLIEAISAAR